MKHIMDILISAFSLGYHGKTIDFEKYSTCHHTTAAHFLNKGKWDDVRLEDILKGTVIQFIYKEAQQFGKPVFCIVDDAISSKTKLSSRALHPIEDAHFLQSYLKGKQGYGHQAVAVMLSCNDRWRYFSVSSRTNWHLAGIRSVYQRESGGAGC